MGEGERGLLRPGVMNRQGTLQSVRVLFQPLLIMTLDCRAWRSPNGESMAGLERPASHRRSPRVYVDRKESER